MILAVDKKLCRGGDSLWDQHGNKYILPDVFRFTIYLDPKHMEAVMIFTELPYNRGISVTNSIEHLIRWSQHRQLTEVPGWDTPIDVRDLSIRYVEHYERQPELYDSVEINPNDRWHPKWKHLGGPQQLQEFIDAPERTRREKIQEDTRREYADIDINAREV